MDGSGLPANFTATANALEGMAFAAKDTLLVVDDFAPTGRQSDTCLQGIAERLFRAAGNQQGRSRLAASGRVCSPQAPRALVLGTGEEVPRGESIRARLLIIEVNATDVERRRLSDCQWAGQEGRFAESMGAFVSWIAGRYEEVQHLRQGRMQEIRSGGQWNGRHARMATALAELQSGWEIFLQFAQAVRAISEDETKQLERGGVGALSELATMQARYQGGDPADRFVSLLRVALATGRGHIADRRGQAPALAGNWGWRRRAKRQGWHPQGRRIGWVSGGDVFLESRTSYEVAQEMAGTERLPLGEQALRHRLRERGLLVSIDVARQMVQVRRTIEGIPRKVLHLKSCDLVGAVAAPFTESLLS